MHPWFQSFGSLRIISCITSRIDVRHGSADSGLENPEDGEHKEKLEKSDKCDPCRPSEALFGYRPAEHFDDDRKVS